MARSGLPVIVPVTEFRDTIGTAITNIVGGRGSGDRTEEGDGGIPAGAGQVERRVIRDLQSRSTRATRSPRRW